jgi:glycosyltransferase involved in cell wall biosynthesis
VKILFVTPQPPWPPRQGTALRNFHLLRALAGRHDVDLLTFAPDLQDGAPDSALPDPAGDDSPAPPDPTPGLCRQVVSVPAPRRTPLARLRDLGAGRADMEGRLRSPAFSARLRQLLQEHDYDAVQLEGFEVAGHLLGLAALQAEARGASPWRQAPTLIFDCHNAEYRLQHSAARVDARRPARWPRAVYSALQARRLRASEALYAAAADVCLAVSPEDAAALEEIVPGLGALVVPNGVDLGAPPPPSPAPRPVVFFAGKLDYRPNVDACEWLVEEIMPRVRERVPDASVVLAGRDPAPAVRRLAGPLVEVTGALSADDLARRRSQAWVEAVPLRMGSGVRFKALEAMAAGIPLVATTLGAAGTGAGPGRHALIADTAPDLAAAISGLLLDPRRRAALATAARSLAAERHSWERITPRLLDLYDRLPLDHGAVRRDSPAPPAARAPTRRAVSLIATVRDERASIDALLTSLCAQQRLPDGAIFVDGGSTDGTLERLTRLQHPHPAATAPQGSSEPLPQPPLPAVRVLSRPGANISQGRNLAAAAGHDLLAVTDAGVRLHPSWLSRLVAPLERDPTLAVSAGFFVADPRGVWELALGATTLPDVDEIDPAAFLPSSRSVAFRKEAWQMAGGYPEWLDYCEDVIFDLALRRVAGPLRFVPRATVRFRPRPTPGAFFRQYYRYARGDGKAGLWPRRHALRYGAYLLGLLLLWPALFPSTPTSRRAPPLLLLSMGGIAYLRRPFRRVMRAPASGPQRLQAVPLLPLVRLIGDVAKMAGYPAGLWWRARHRRGGA